MKNRFPGYFDLTEVEHDRLWDEGLIVVDTNILLDLYRVPEKTRDRMFELLQSWKGRIWVPHQVGVEFLGMRVKTINEVHRRSTTVVDDMVSKHDAFRSAAEDMKLAERGLNDVPETLNKIEALVKELSDKAIEALSGALKPDEHDHILDRLNMIVDGNVGKAPSNQECLSKIYKEGALRYELKMGPGYEDAKKAERKGARYFVGGLTYESQYSDLVLWKQTIAHVKSTGVKRVLFLSKDVKKDWWQIVNGEERIAPLPELRQEMIAEGGAESFWIITLEDALAKYGRKKGVDVEQAIEDVRLADLSDYEKNYHVRYSITSDQLEPLRQVNDSETILGDAAAAMKLDVDYKSKALVAGRTATYPGAAVLITTIEGVRESPFFVMAKVRDAATSMQVRDQPSYIRVVVVVEPFPDRDLVASASGYASTLALNILTTLSIRTVVGFVQGGHFVSVYESSRK